MENTVILGLSASKQFAQQIRDKLGIISLDPMVEQFADGEIYVRLSESVRGKNVYVVQSTSTPVNDSIMELLITMDACRRASAKTINVIMPYMGYARQDRKSKSREPITAKVLANVIETTGASKVITFDLHASQIQGFFKCPVDDLAALSLLAGKFKDIKNPVVVAPDHGGSKRARELADILKCSVAVIDKARTGANKVEVMGMIGDVDGKNAIIIDDMIDTAGTICKAAETVMESGAKSVAIAATHGLFSGPAIQRLKDSVATKVYVTNTIYQENKFDKLEVVSLSEFMADVIEANEKHKSVGTVYDKWVK